MSRLSDEVGKDQAYNPFSTWSDKPDAPRVKPAFTPEEGRDFIYNPYGISLDRSRKGKFPVYGGRGELVKSIATRSLGIEGIKKQMEQSPQVAGLSDAINQYARDNPALMAAVESYLPQLESSSIIQDQQNQAQLRELMSGAYVLGGGIYGAALKAESIAQQQKRAYDKAKTDRLKGIVGNAMRGLGMNQYGEADTTEGIIGGAEW